MTPSNKSNNMAKTESNSCKLPRASWKPPNTETWAVSFMSVPGPHSTFLLTPCPFYKNKMVSYPCFVKLKRYFGILYDCRKRINTIFKPATKIGNIYIELFDKLCGIRRNYAENGRLCGSAPAHNARIPF